MLNDKKDILQDAEFISKLKEKREISAYEKSKNRFFILSIFLSLIIIGLIYFLSSASNIYNVVVFGNVYLSDEDVIELSQLDNNDKYLFTFPSFVENRILQNKLIKSCNVTLEDENLIIINIEEYKAIGYGNLDGNYALLLENNEKILLDENNLYLISYVPLLEGFSNEDLILIVKNLETIDYKMINEISEIHYYPNLKYQSVELIMRDGNYIFTSAYGLNMLNSYYDIESSNNRSGNDCYYFEDISGNAYLSACPWLNSTNNNEKLQ